MMACFILQCSEVMGVSESEWGRPGPDHTFFLFLDTLFFICLGHGCLPGCLSVSCAHVGAGEGVGFPLEQELHTVFSYCVDAGT